MNASRSALRLSGRLDLQGSGYCVSSVLLLAAFRLGGGGFGEVACAQFMSLWSSATLR